jgi:hypothetical protein
MFQHPLNIIKNTSGGIETKFENNVADIEVKGLSIWHVYFEYVIMGYEKRH